MIITDVTKFLDSINVHGCTYINAQSTITTEQQIFQREAE